MTTHILIIPKPSQAPFSRKIPIYPDASSPWCSSECRLLSSARAALQQSIGKYQPQEGDERQSLSVLIFQVQSDWYITFSGSCQSHKEKKCNFDARLTRQALLKWRSSMVFLDTVYCHDTWGLTILKRKRVSENQVLSYLLKETSTPPHP